MNISNVNMDTLCISHHLQTWICLQINVLTRDNGKRAGGESSFPHTSTNVPLAVGVLNRLRTVHYCQQARYVHQFVHQFSVGDLTTSIPHTDIALIALE